MRVYVQLQPNIFISSYKQLHLSVLAATTIPNSERVVHRLIENGFAIYVMNLLMIILVKIEVCLMSFEQPIS